MFVCVLVLMCIRVNAHAGFSVCMFANSPLSVIGTLQQSVMNANPIVK